LLQIKAAV